MSTPSPAPTPALFAALVQAQAAAKAVPHDAKNDYHGYRYTSAEAIITEARDVLTKVGLAVVQDGWRTSSVDVELTDAEGVVRKDQERTLHVRFLVLHQDGESMSHEVEIPVLPEKGRPLDKAAFAALTYAESYFLRGLLCLPRVAASDDIDQRDDTAHEPRRTSSSARAPASASGPKTIVNKLAAPCTYCESTVEIGDGFARTEGDGKWRTIHAKCRDAFQREQAEAESEPVGAAS